MTLADIAITLIPKLGSRGCRKLIDTYGSAEAVYATPYERLIAEVQLQPDIAKDIAQGVGLREAEAEIRHLARHNIKAIAATDAEYPQQLFAVCDRPHVLYLMGDEQTLRSPHKISVVGTRRVSRYGEVACTRLIKELGEMFPDLVVFSGLAFGADSVAHRAAISTNVRTVAIVPTTLPDIVPTTHAALARGIVESGGALLSEMNTLVKHNGKAYIPRNRIVAGISDGVFVVESAIDGGTLSTVRCADSYGYPVMALPGRITDPMSEGTNHIIKSGVAQLITSATDIAESLGWQPTPSAKVFECEVQECSPREMMILDCFADGGAYTTDEIALRCNISTSEASAMLLELELSGVVHQCAGNKYEKM